MILKSQFHHIGVAVRNIQETAAIYIDAGFCLSQTVFDNLQNVNIAFLQREGHPMLELVEPLDKSSPVYNILKKAGVSAYHFCYQVSQIGQTIEELESRDFKLIVEPVNAIAFNNRKICFLYHLDAGLIELLEI